MPWMPLTMLKPQKTDTKRSSQYKVRKTLILTKYASLRGYGIFPFLFFVRYICNINMHMYITSVRTHELSGRVCANTYNYMLCLALQISL